MKQLLSILTVLICLCLSSCVDLFERTYWSDDNYEVVDNSGDSSFKTLYYKLDNGGGIGRVDFIKKIGSDENFIILESANVNKSNKL